MQATVTMTITRTIDLPANMLVGLIAAKLEMPPLAVEPTTLGDVLSELEAQTTYTNRRALTADNVAGNPRAHRVQR